jgi:hypothetical protein
MSKIRIRSFPGIKANNCCLTETRFFIVYQTAMNHRLSDYFGEARFIVSGFLVLIVIAKKMSPEILPVTFSILMIIFILLFKFQQQM